VSLSLRGRQMHCSTLLTIVWVAAGRSEPTSIRHPFPLPLPYLPPTVRALSCLHTYASCL
jgi:hypothetical protein